MDAQTAASKRAGGKRRRGVQTCRAHTLIGSWWVILHCSKRKGRDPREAPGAGARRQQQSQVQSERVGDWD